jgi:hypothetical protein
VTVFPASVVEDERHHHLDLIGVSPDGRWMLSTQSQGESDLMLVEAFR